MKRFFVRMLFVLLWVITLAVLAFLLPPSPFEESSLEFSQIDKNKLLAQTPSPRIILVGGSNVPFGVDSQMIKDSLNLNPVNTGVNAVLGLKFMLRNVAQFVKPGDIVLLCPEYDQFYGSFADGDSDLVLVLCDAVPQTARLLDSKQLFHLIKYFPGYVRDKLNPFIYIKHFDIKRSTGTIDGVYYRNAFNKYGDNSLHRKFGHQKFAPYPTIEGELSFSVFKELETFRGQVTARHASLFVTFPPYQDRSYDNSLSKIDAVEKGLKQRGFKLISRPKEFRFPDSLMFNAPYHLSGKGVVLYTNSLINELTHALKTDNK